jgi:hypothetical protein
MKLKVSSWEEADRLFLGSFPLFKRVSFLSEQVTCDLNMYGVKNG